MGGSSQVAPTKSYKSKHQDPNYKGEPAEAELSKGPIEKRSCTDCLCCLIFVAFVCAMIATGVTGLTKGDPEKLIAPYDSDGNICGEGKTENYKYLYFAIPFPGYLDHSVCVSTCPQYTTTYPTSISCATNSNYTSCNGAFTSENDFLDLIKKVATGQEDPDKNDLYIYNTTSFVGRYCLPSSEYFSKLTAVSGYMVDGDTLERWVSDVKTSWSIILASLGIAFVFGLFYLIFVRYCSGVLVWLSILGVIAGAAGFGYYLFWYAKKLEKKYESNGQDDGQNTNTITTLKVFAYIMWGVAGFIVLAVCCLYSRIKLAIGIIKTAADYVKDTWTAMLVPIVMVILLAGLYVYWIFVAIYLYSYGDVTKRAGSPIGKVTWNKNTKRLLVFHLFGGLWANAFVIAASQLILASSTALWYFEVQYGKAHGTIRRSVWRAFRYHLGSLAFGSFILALIQFIRIVWAYVQNKLKPYGDKTGGCLIKYGVWYITCCLACFERYIRFLNKNAYIQIAIEGKSFLSAAISAFYLILRNGMMFVIVGGLGEIFIGLGKWVIAVVTAGISYVILTRSDYYEEKLYSALIPLFIIFCLAYGVGAIFMSVYGMAADTILQCYILTKDLKNNHSVDIRPPTALQDFIDKHPKVKAQDKD